MFLSAERSQCLQAMIDFLLGIIAHRASVQKYGIGLFGTLADLVACHLHDRSHDLRVGHVHLASVCLDIQFFH